ncbi:four-carbon acid sugar kinase family protein [Bryocella elongata]|nr:four-carbon acid sugar kinase family protein [Bryocella elongata]
MLADDLTGACDAAAPFAMRGLRTEVGIARNATRSSECQVWSCSSESREANASSVEPMLARVLGRIPPAAAFFKKVDSVFRGNTFAEVASVRRLRPERTAILAPAFPAAGRLVKDGVLEIQDLSGTRSLRLIEKLRDQGLTVHHITASCDADELRCQLADDAGSEGSVILYDATVQLHLDALVNAADALEAPLWIGSAGLAHAIAESFSSGSTAIEPRVDTLPQTTNALLYFVGSTHPVTRAQVEALAQHRERMPNIQVIDVPRGPAARDLILDAVWGLRSETISCLFVTGGDTASAVFAALGITALRVVDEFAPGLPHCHAIGGRFDGVPVLLKSGGFGEASGLCDIAERFAPMPAHVGRSSL